MKTIIILILFINSYLFTEYYLYEINYKIDNTYYSTQLELPKYENPKKIQDMYLGYLSNVCITPDTIWINVKQK